MRVHIRLGLLLVLAGVLMALGVGSAFAAVDSVYRASTSSAGVQGDVGSTNGAISASGRYVAFASSAKNLVDGDTNGYADIFLKDRWSGATVRITGPGGVQPDEGSGNPSISDDGRYVAFQSFAANYVAGDTHTYTDVFVWDRASGVVTKVSTGVGGALANGSSTSPKISRDGKSIVYVSEASNIVAGDAVGNADTFIYDVATATNTRVSVLLSGVEANGDSGAGAASNNGAYVVFVSAAKNFAIGDLNNMPDVWRWNRATKLVEPVSVTPAGSFAGGGSGTCDVSADGNVVSFSSSADDVVLGDTNGHLDVFVRDMGLGRTTRVSVATSGLQGLGESGLYSSLSADGRFVAFSSTAGNLVDGDANGVVDVFLHDRTTGATRLLSASSAGVVGNGASNFPVLASEGGYAVFGSMANNLIADDTNGNWDVYVKQLAIEPTYLWVTSATLMPFYDVPLELVGHLTLRAADGPGIADQDLVLQKLNGIVWANVQTAKTSAVGEAKFSVKPGVKTTYRVVYAGLIGAYTGLEGGTVHVAPHVRLGTPKAPKTMKKGRYSTVYGSLKPRHTKGTKPVRIYKYKKVSGVWKSYGYVKAKAYNYKGYTRYKVRMKLSSKGSWRLRAKAPADSKHQTTWSAKYDYVKVK